MSSRPIKIRNRRQPLMAGAAFCFLVASAFAQESPVQAAPVSAMLQQPLWEAGLFGLGVTQSAYPGADDRASQALVLPYVIYRGKYLRADRGNVGVRALKTPRIEVDVGFAASLGSHSSDRRDAAWLTWAP